MRRLRVLGAAWLILAAASGVVLAQGLPDVRLGNEAFRQGDYAAAVTHYTDAIRSGELVGEALAITYNNRGVAYGEAGDFDPAIADYSQALALRPGDATTIRNLRVAHVRRGEVSFASGNYDAAVADFTQATELEPDHHLAYQRRGELHAELGLLDLAVEDLERAALLSPGDPEIVAALGRVTAQRESIVAAVEQDASSDPEPTPTAGAEPPLVEPELAEEVPADEPPSPPSEITAAPADEPEAEEPTVVGRPEPAPRVAAADETPEAPAAPAAAPPAQAEARPQPTTPAPAPAQAAPTPAPAATASGEGERYRVISAVNYRAGPDNSAERLGTVDAGRIVRVVGDTLGWKHVILPNGERGFIYQRWLEPAGE